MTWRRWLAAAAFALASLVGSFAAGRFTAPTRVEEREHVVYRDRVKIERVTEQAQAKATEQQQAVRVVTRWIRTTAPDGSTREEQTTDSSAATAAKTSEASSSSDKLASEKETFVDKQRERIVETRRQDWSASLLVGWDRLQARPNVFGGMVSRRIIGPVELGAWATTERTAGIAATVRW